MSDKIEITIIIETTNQLLKECIAAGIAKERGDVEIDIDQIKDFQMGNHIIANDVKNIFMGSCFGQLVCESVAVDMRITG